MDEDAFLLEMATWTPLPDEDDPRWGEVTHAGSGVWADADRLLAAADLAGARGWTRVAVKVYEFVSDWDLHGQLLDVRHGPERAFLASSQGVAGFARELAALATHPRAGTRLWAVRELGVLRQAESLPVLAERCTDHHSAVADAARLALEMVEQAHPAGGAAHRADGTTTTPG